jgi:hypothetical protein
MDSLLHCIGKVGDGEEGWWLGGESGAGLADGAYIEDELECETLELKWMC